MPAGEPALCQCIKCLRYLAQNRLNDQSFVNNCCEECATNGIPLAKIRGTLTEPLSVELLALLSEECGEVTQRIGKILRWGWDADFEGTTQQHKLETELGDILAAVALLAYSDKVSIMGVLRAYTSKIDKLIEDEEGPRQRLSHAQIPNAAWFVMRLWDQARSMPIAHPAYLDQSKRCSPNCRAQGCGGGCSQ